MTAGAAGITVREFCEWWIATVVLIAGEKALPTAYQTAAVLAADPVLHEVERRARKGGQLHGLDA